MAFFAFWVVVLIIPKVSDTTLKLALLLVAPLSYRYGWYFFAALLTGLVYGSEGALTAAFGGVFALFVDWLDGVHILGVLPPHAPLVAASPLAVPFPSWAVRDLQQPHWTALMHLAVGIGPYAVPAISALVVVALVGRAAGALRGNRRLRDDALAVGLPSLGGLWHG